MKKFNHLPIEIKITGSGTPDEVSSALIILAQEIRMEQYSEALESKGECQWEDPILMTVVTRE